MKQNDNISYMDFLRDGTCFDERRKCRTEKGQRKRMLESIERLAAQKDFWSIEIIRAIADALASGNEDFYCLMRMLSGGPDGLTIEFFGTTGNVWCHWEDLKKSRKTA